MITYKHRLFMGEEILFLKRVLKYSPELSISTQGCLKNHIKEIRRIIKDSTLSAPEEKP